MPLRQNAAHHDPNTAPPPRGHTFCEHIELRWSVIPLLQPLIEICVLVIFCIRSLSGRTPLDVPYRWMRLMFLAETEYSFDTAHCPTDHQRPTNNATCTHKQHHSIPQTTSQQVELNTQQRAKTCVVLRCTDHKLSRCFRRDCGGRGGGAEHIW